MPEPGVPFGSAEHERIVLVGGVEGVRPASDVDGIGMIVLKLWLMIVVRCGMIANRH
jgi:hypothetical protein